MRQRTVLLIAANPQEVQRTRCSFAQAGLHPIFQVVSDGEEALAYLRREGVYRFAEVIGHLGRFWLETVEFPSDA